MASVKLPDASEQSDIRLQKTGGFFAIGPPVRSIIQQHFFATSSRRTKTPDSWLPNSRLCLTPDRRAFERLHRGLRRRKREQSRPYDGGVRESRDDPSRAHEASLVCLEEALRCCTRVVGIQDFLLVIDDRCGGVAQSYNKLDGTQGSYDAYVLSLQGSSQKPYWEFCARFLDDCETSGRSIKFRLINKNALGLNQMLNRAFKTSGEVSFILILF